MSFMKFEFNYKNLFFIAGALLLLTLLYRVQEILTTFGISFFIAYLFDPVADKLESYKLSRGFSVTIIFLIFIIFSVLILSLIIPLIYNEIIFLTKSIPEIYAKIFSLVEKGAAALDIDVSLEAIKKASLGKAGMIAKALADGTGTLFSSLLSTVSVIVNLCLIPVLVFYFLKDYDQIMEKGFNIIKKKSGQDYTGYLNQFNKILSTYFRGQFIVAMILVFLYTTVMLLAGVKPAVLLGLVAGLFSVVPYLGFFVGFASAFVLSIVQYGDVIHPVYVIIGFVIVQMIEGNFITPKIVGESLGLHPTVVILALMVGGYLLGIGGMIFALPVAAFIKILLQNWLCEEDEKLDSVK